MKHPAPSKEEIARVERTVGHRLPAALVNLYASRGNGGFGPEYGLLGLAAGHVTDQGDTALGLYEILCTPDPDSPGWVWPKSLFPILHIGCNIHYCIDLLAPGNPVLRFDPNGLDAADSWDGAFTVVSLNLEPWLCGL
jgi:hypothetical protein